MVRNLFDRLLEGGQSIRPPRGLFDVIEAYDTEFLGYPQAEFETSPVHEAKRQEIRDTEDAVRRSGSSVDPFGGLQPSAIAGGVRLHRQH